MKSRIGHALRPLAGTIAVCCLLASARAVAPSSPVWTGGGEGSSTNWNETDNWSTNSVPNSTTAAAIFSTGAFNVTPMITGNAISVGTITFNAGAPAYTITVTDYVGEGTSSGSLDIYGAGVTNNSSSVQTFIVQSIQNLGGAITFHNSATAGNAVYQVSNNGAVNFNDNSTAGSATITTTGGANVNFNNNSTAGNAFITNSTNATGAGYATFSNSSTAGSATIVNIGPSTTVAAGVDANANVIDLGTGAIVRVASTNFYDNSSAGNATITNYNGAYTQFLNNASAGSARITNNTGGLIGFFTNSSAASATIINNSGGRVIFAAYATATNATTIINNAGSYLDISTLLSGGVSIGQVTGAGNIYLGANKLTIGGQNANATISGVISDGVSPGYSELTVYLNDGSLAPVTNFTGGSLAKIGTGSLTLTGANTYTGSTTVGQGSLYVDGSIASPMTTVSQGALLGGTGVIGGSVVNNGAVSPGDAPGTLTIKKNYTQSPTGALLIRIGGLAPLQYDLLAIGGTARLAGTLQLQQLNNFKFTLGDKVTFLTAAGGVSGQFTSVYDPFITDPLIALNIAYYPTSVALEATQVPLTSIPGLTPNEYAVATALDEVLANPRFAKLFRRLDNESISSVINDLDRLGPEELTSIFQIAISQGQVQTFNIQRRLEELHYGSNGFSSSGFAMNGISPGYAGPQGDIGLLEGPDGKDGKMALTPAPNNRWGFFITGAGEFTSIGDDSNARGYDFVTGGFTFGGDYKFTDHFAVGLAAGYDHTDADLVNGGRVTVDGGKLALYGTYLTGKGFYTDFAVQGGYNGYETTRAAIAGPARGNTDGGEFNALFGTGYDWKIGGLTFGPTANFEYTYVSLDGFNERGSLAPLTFRRQSQDSVRTTFGAKASYDLKIGGVTVVPELRLGWQHEYGDNSLELVSQFDQGGPQFAVHGPTTGRDSLIVGAGFAVRFSERLSTYVYYDGELGRTNYESNNVSGGFRVSF